VVSAVCVIDGDDVWGLAMSFIAASGNKLHWIAGFFKVLRI
jgi:hypothetical protein